MERQQTIIHISDDFDMEKIADSGQCFRWEKTEPDTFRIIAGRSCLYMKALGEDIYALDCSRQAFEGFWQDYFDLKENYGRIRTGIDPAEDPFLFRAARAEKGIRILRQDPWEMLITFIISQNRNIPAIRRSVELLAEDDRFERQDLLCFSGSGSGGLSDRGRAEGLQAGLPGQVCEGGGRSCQ